MDRSQLELDIATLRHSDSFKWTKYPPDVLPLWVADMDFSIAPSIRAALKDRLDTPIGYNHVEGDAELIRLLREKMERSGWRDLPARGWVRFLTGVVSAIGASVIGLTTPGEGVITTTPIYPPFLGAIEDHGRILRDAPLVQGADRWEIDWDAMESAACAGATMLLFCHPHNPTGRVWTGEELAKVGEFAERHNLWIASDELHADLTLDGTHVPLASVLNDTMRKRTVTLTGPCKAYNTAGLGIGAIVGHDPSLVSRIMKANAWVTGHPTALSVAMWKAALQDNSEWLAVVLCYLRDNRDFLESFVREHLADVGVKHVEATYLAWLDYRRHPHASHIGRHLLEQAKVALNDGPMFGKQYEGFVRINFATSHAILSEALERMASIHNI